MKFEPGKTYQTRSICDYNCIISLTVLARTEKSIKIKDNRGVRTLRVKEFDGHETVKPWGSYSMAPIVRA